MFLYTPSLNSAFLTLVSLAQETSTTDWLVPDDYPTIQAAIQAVQPTDRIFVAPGVYPESIEFLGKDLRISSLAGPEFTIIDGQNTNAVVRFHSGESPVALLHGFTIRGGLASGTAPCGGGISIVGASPTIRGNVIEQNQANCGGGIGVRAGFPLIEGNIIRNNLVPNENGGGIYLWFGSDAVVRGNTLATNYGGGLYAFQSSPLIEFNQFLSGNSSLGDCPGSGVKLHFSFATLRGNLIRGFCRIGLTILGAGETLTEENVIEKKLL